ncbi:MAG: hypothetical protein IPK14_16385 [Blastocatellia bacterium]|nr:hypothetical protein [Blastocatellia bacterium]MBL8193837.1 hypothetical protein [Blastocatellia bacterium]MBN8724472.1 hypothetical protein [Acidobacteriota bacterium]
MATKISNRRILLKRVESLPLSSPNPEQVRVILQVDNRLSIGQVNIPPIDQGILEATALATIQALKKALPEGAVFVLKKALKLNPKFLDDALIVTVLDVSFDDLELNLTGASIVRSEKVIWGTANAVLDATNRFTSFLLEIEQEQDRDELDPED